MTKNESLVFDNSSHPDIPENKVQTWITAKQIHVLSQLDNYISNIEHCAADPHYNTHFTQKIGHAVGLFH